MNWLKRLSWRQTPAINSYYVTTAPSEQNAVDIFKGDWSSQLPPPLDHLNSGKVDLFDDARIKWLVAQLGGIQGKQVLELGPLEGGHSYVLSQNGAGSITAIEANTHAYLRCLIAKELLGTQRVRFLCGDFVEYLKDPSCPTFDIVVASGVLYHMINPVELIGLLAQRCRSHLLIWTHYYDKAWVEANKRQSTFPFEQAAQWGGFSHTLVRQDYGRALRWKGFCGGSRPYSHWMYRHEIIKCLEHFGFDNVEINFEQPNQANGPAFTLLASRS